MNAFLRLVDNPNVGFVIGYIILFIYMKVLRGDVAEIKKKMIWRDTYEADKGKLESDIETNKKEIDRLRNGR